MVTCYSLFSPSIKGQLFTQLALDSIATNWFVFNPEIIFYNSPKLIILGLLLCGFLGILIYQFFKIKAKIGGFIEKKREIETANREYQLYLLLFGIAIIVIEIINEIFRIRPTSLLVINVGIGFLVLLSYIVIVNVKYLCKRIQYIFISIFLIYVAYVARNIIVLTNDIVPIIAFLISFFFSYTILKPIKIYWIFVATVFFYLIISIVFHLIPIKSSILLINYCIMVFIINHVKHTILISNRDNFRFTNEIVHKGNSLTIATNKKGEILFCSETITSILGYLPEEVMDLEFWKLTEDSEFIKEKHGHNYTTINYIFGN
jgi:hypothetical protein